MPLTRNLYELDEVISALQLCLHEGDDQALFWLWELVVSKEETAALGAVEEAVIRLGDPRLLIGPNTDWIRLYVSIRNTKDSVTSLLARATQPSKRLGFAAGLKDAFRRKNKVAAAWYIKEAQGVVPTDEIWSALTGVKMNGTSMIYQVAAATVLCDRPERPPPIEKAKGRWDSWTAAIGRRKARAFAIPERALHAGTTRGQLPAKYTNIADIREPVGLLSEGCKFWQEALAAMGITEDEETNAVCFPDDDVLERFHEKYFPDDIPDEWSAADQQKSHGRGVLEKGYKKVEWGTDSV